MEISIFLLRQNASYRRESLILPTIRRVLRDKLGGYKMIAGLWEDIDLRKSQRADAGVYVVQPSASRLIFRWQGVPCNFDGSVCTGGAPINFEIELNTNGTIKTRYGSGNTNIFPTVGIGGGEHDAYIIASHTSEETPISLTNAGEVTFAPRTATGDTVQFSQAAFSVNEARPYCQRDRHAKWKRFRCSHGELRDDRQLRREL